MGNFNKEVRYLYGASVQGIQDFIFQTNKLAEIVGASGLVDHICSKAFLKYADDTRESDKNWIVGAAGKIVYIFTSEEKCKKAVKEFPREVMGIAPGITISQSVVVMDENNDYIKASKKLETNLRIQRNKPMRSMTLGLMSISRAPSTGLPAVSMNKENELIDEASKCKLNANKTVAEGESLTLSLARKSFGEKVKEEHLLYEIDKMTGINNWVAVIHADGNGLGRIVEEVGQNEKDMQAFSLMLDKVTQESAQLAYQSVKDKFVIPNVETDKQKIPIRPIVLGGDDLTVICRADLALEYTHVFLKEFEENSKNYLSKIEFLNQNVYKLLENGLTACAGIAFIKSSYPFHYAIHLAESLCSRAKKHTKAIDLILPPSCLMFHKVQDSFVEDFEEIVKRELTPLNSPNLSFEYGPYYCGKRSLELQCKNTVQLLLENVGKLNGEDDNKDNKGVKSGLRQWLSILHEDVEMANQKMKRLRTVSPLAKKIISEKYTSLKRIDKITIPFYDMLSLASIGLENENKKKQQ